MRNIKGFLAIFGGFLLHLTLGTLYCWGNLNPYVTSYIRRHSQPATLQYSATVWVFALAILGQGCSMFIGGILERKIGSRLASLTGCMITSLGVFLSFFTIKASYYLFLLTYGFVFGIGIGIAYAPPMSVAMRWFPRYKGLVNGFIVAGFGGGAFIFDFVQTAFINPMNVKAVNASVLNTTQDIGDNKYFNNEDVLSKVPYVFLLLAGCYMVMQLVGVLLMFSPPSELSSLPPERVSLFHDESNGSNLDTRSSEESYPPLQIIKTRPFITMWFMFMLNALVVLFISTLYKTYAQSEVVNNDKLLAGLGSLSAVFNAAGRIVWGFYADRVSFRAAMITLCSAMTILMSSLYITHLVSQSAGVSLLFVWICLIFFSFSGNYSLFPTATAKTFGPRYVSINYGLLFTSSAVSSVVGALLSELLLNNLQSYGLFILSGVLSLISMILALSFNAKLADGSQV